MRGHGADLGAAQGQGREAVVDAPLNGVVLVVQTGGGVVVSPAAGSGLDTTGGGDRESHDADEPQCAKLPHGVFPCLEQLVPWLV